jgi:hypothetical protein
LVLKKTHVPQIQDKKANWDFVPCFTASHHFPTCEVGPGSHFRWNAFLSWQFGVHASCEEESGLPQHDKHTQSAKVSQEVNPAASDTLFLFFWK